LRLIDQGRAHALADERPRRLFITEAWHQREGPESINDKDD
jgi:hypothetical protein